MSSVNIRSHAPTVAEFRTDECPEFDVERNDDGDVVLTIKTEDGDTVRINIGCFYDSAEGLETALRDAADAIKTNILTDWEDTPDEYDGWVSEGRDGYYVSLEGIPRRNTRHGYASRDIAVYELAQAMADAGCFPNAWYSNERGNTENIGEEVRKHHDAGGSSMLPLEGVEYEEGDAVIYSDPAWPWIVDKDYGQLGVVIHEQYDTRNRAHVTDRSEIARYDATHYEG